MLADRGSLVLGFLHAGFLLIFLPAPPALGEGFVPSVQPSPVEMEHVSTVPVVTATNRPTEHENLLSFYILLNPRLRTLSKILLRDATKVFNDIAYNRFAMSFYHSVES